jgi:hypothetical protein
MTGYVSTRYYRAPEIMLTWQKYDVAGEHLPHSLFALCRLLIFRSSFQLTFGVRDVSLLRCWRESLCSQEKIVSTN